MPVSTLPDSVGAAVGTATCGAAVALLSGAGATGSCGCSLQAPSENPRLNGTNTLAVNSFIILSGPPARMYFKATLSPAHQAAFQVKHVVDVVLDQGLLGKPGASSVDTVQHHAVGIG